MLVVPKGRDRALLHGGWPVTLGDLLTAAGCVIFLAACSGPPPRARRVAARLELPPIPPRPRSCRPRPLVGADAGRGAGRHLAASPSCSAWRRCRARHRRGRHLPAGQAFYGAGRLAEAVPFFERARRLAPLSMSAIHSTYFEGMSLYPRSNGRRPRRCSPTSSRPSRGAGGCRVDVSPGPLPRAPRQSGRRVEAWRDTSSATPAALGQVRRRAPRRGGGEGTGG